MVYKVLSQVSSKAVVVITINENTSKAFNAFIIQ